MTQIQAFEEYCEEAERSGEDADLYAVRDYADGYRTVIVGGVDTPLISGEVTSIILTYIDSGFAHLLPEDLRTPEARLIVNWVVGRGSQEAWGIEAATGGFDRLLGKGTGKPVLSGRPELWPHLTGKGFTRSQT